MNKKLLGIPSHTFFSTLILLLFALVSSCSQDDDASPDTAANTHVNDWILENMEFWYLWNNELPASPDKTKAPDEFFQSLLSDDDRFSWIQDDYQELLNSLQGITKEAGFEYVLYKEDGSNNVITQILYVKPGSPAEGAGLKRGDVITKVNGQTPTTNNYQDVLKNLTSASFSITYKPLVIDEQRFDGEKAASLSTVVYTEDPNYLSKVVDINGKKVGYYVYNFFSSGTDSDANKYDSEMDAIFADFKAQGITDLVLDLRFNSGGSETSATNLASLITPDANNSKIFFKKEYNANVEDEILKDPNAGPSFLQRNLVAKAQNVGNEISGKVYILTGSRTASASELIINGVKPFMNVVLIGDVTYGKNVGSISLYDDEDPENTWGMQPIVLKVYNSLDQSDYSAGFTPNIEEKDNQVIIYPLGDINEIMFNKALEQITGAPVGGRKAQFEEAGAVLAHSLDGKRRSFILNVTR
jgi:carboxyl-terminal processing protease